MKARRVQRLDPAGTLHDNAARIVRVRLSELRGFMPTARDPREVTALHDMRIAAKRLRYVLEVTGFCFGPAARKAGRAAKELQEVLGEIHDCDVMLPRVRAHARGLRDEDAAALAFAAGRRARDLDPALVATAPNAGAHRGLTMLELHLRARREVLFARFIALWDRLERSDMAGELERALDEPPATMDGEAPPQP